MTLIFASNNVHKLEELRSAIGNRIKILSLAEAGIRQDIPEPFDTLRENALTKAETIHILSGGCDCFSEDSGLEVDALGGQPGVHSARYAGEPPSSAKNIQKLLTDLEHLPDRTARFVTVICLIHHGESHFFEGRCEGRILYEPAGQEGFGYDAIFMPEGSEKSFAEMKSEEKNRYSHRRKAGDLLISFLETIHHTH